jgi:VWFA-related protein
VGVGRSHAGLLVALLSPLNLVLGSGGAHPQQRRTDVPEFPARVEMVTVDVVVTDSKGRPVGGLSGDDFTLTEDGAAQTLSTFEAIELAGQPTSAPPGPTVVSTNVRADSPLPRGRWFGIVLDDLHLEQREAQYARAAVTRFLETAVREGDLVTLATTSGEVWWTAAMLDGREEVRALLEHVEAREVPPHGPDWMSPYEAQRIWVFLDGQVGGYVMRRFASNGLLDPDAAVKARAPEVYQEAFERCRRAVEVLERLLRPLEGGGRPGVLILLSGGFMHDTRLEGLRQVLEISHRSNVSIHFVDSRGLMGMPAQLEADSRGASLAGLPFWAQASSSEGGADTDIDADRNERLFAAAGPESLALDSGGLIVRNTNDPTKGMAEIAEGSRVHYILGYLPTNAARDGTYRAIEVRVKRRGLKVRARKGYYAPLEGEAFVARGAGSEGPWYQPALDSPLPVRDIPLRVASYAFEESQPGRARTTLATEVDIRDLGRRASEGSPDVLDMVLLVGDPKHGTLMRQEVTVSLTAHPETRRELRASWLPVLRDVELAPGAYKARIVVRDRESGRIGSVDHRFEVPGLLGLRASGVVITDTLEPRPDATTSQLEPRVLAHRAFPAGSVLFVRYDVYGAAEDPGTGRPRVLTGLEIRRRDGTVLGRGELVPITPSSDGRLSRTSDVRLAAPPGTYDLVLTIRDDVAGRELRVREEFTTVAPDPDQPFRGDR